MPICVHQPLQPIAKGADFGELPVVLVGHHPKAAGQSPIGQQLDQISVALTKKAGEDADASPRRNHLVLRADAGGPQTGRQAGFQLIQIVQLGRIEHIRDIADQAKAMQQGAVVAGQLNAFGRPYY